MYNLSNASAGSDAVKEAVKFFQSQNRPLKVFSASRRLPINAYETYISNQHTSLPLCNISYKDISSNGMFLYDARPLPYEGCFARRIRYHIAPRCTLLEERSNIVPIHHWHWILNSAFSNKCRMPSANIFATAASYLSRHHKQQNTVTILMLGLSFMAQPFQSLICLNQAYVDADHSYAYMHNERYVLADIIANGAQCTGASNSEIPKYFDSSIHGDNYTLPQQNVDSCSLHHSSILFRPPDSALGAPNVHVCYVYSFNLQKNLKPHASLPCNLTWNQIDVIFGLHKKAEILKYYLPRTGASPEELSHVTYVTAAGIYQATLFAQLKEAYAAYGFHDIDVSNLQAKPMSCEHADIHYRLPGITDYAAQIWLQLVGYGLPMSSTTEITFVE